MMKNVCVMGCALALSSVANAKEISETDLLSLPEADVLFLGEVHDNPVHHANQALVLRTIGAAAVVFEMLTPENATKITSDLLNDQEALGQVLGWQQSGWPDFDMYYPIFAASSGAEIYGAQVSRSSAREAVMGGDVAAVFGADAELFGLSRALPENRQAEREAKQMVAHCDALPEHMLPGMVLAQRLRDATLARAAAEALEATGGPVAVITGNGHARTDWGASALMPEGISVLSVGQLEAAPEGTQPYDLWLVTEAAEREDPCAAFGK